jgi:thioredoxin reductase (NADPH)
MDESTPQWSLPDDAKKVLTERFREMKNKTVLEVFTKEKENDQFNTLTVLFTKELERLTDKIEIHINKIGEEKSKKYNVTRSQTILIQPDLYHIRYTGAPFGEEGRSFIDTIMLVSQRNSGLSQTSREILSKLEEKRHVMVFVSMVCPYCPHQVLNAFKAAIERPDLIRSECVEVTENIDLIRKYGVGAVPQTVINDQTLSHGLEPEEQFIAELVTLKPAEEFYPEHPPSSQEAIEVDLVIVGGGPAGLTAGIYAARSGLKTIILEKDTIGGQVLITPLVENWPGFQRIPGKQLMDMVSSQVRNYAPVLEGEEVREIKVGKHIEAVTARGRYLAKALIIATGARYKKLNVPGEDKFYGHGVSYCATCDGYLYKDKPVIVVGGGNTALTDALYLKNIGAQVTMIHRKDRFRGESALQESVRMEDIPVLRETVIEEISGKKTVTSVKVKNLSKGTMKNIATAAVFVAVGEMPNNRLAVDIGVKLDEHGYVEVDRYGRTNIPRVYAAGDVTGGVRQIVTAVGEGAAAATAAFEDISSPYWIPKTT